MSAFRRGHSDPGPPRPGSPRPFHSRDNLGDVNPRSGEFCRRVPLHKRKDVMASEAEVHLLRFRGQCKFQHAEFQVAEKMCNEILQRQHNGQIKGQLEPWEADPHMLISILESKDDEAIHLSFRSRHSALRWHPDSWRPSPDESREEEKRFGTKVFQLHNLVLRKGWQQRAGHCGNRSARCETPLRRKPASSPRRNMSEGQPTRPPETPVSKPRTCLESARSRPFGAMHSRTDLRPPVTPAAKLRGTRSDAQSLDTPKVQSRSTLGSASSTPCEASEVVFHTPEKSSQEKLRPQPKAGQGSQAPPPMCSPQASSSLRSTLAPAGTNPKVKLSRRPESCPGSLNIGFQRHAQDPRGMPSGAACLQAQHQFAPPSMPRFAPPSRAQVAAAHRVSPRLPFTVGSQVRLVPAARRVNSTG